MIFAEHWPIVPLAQTCIELQAGFAREPNDSNAGVIQLRMPSISATGYVSFDVVKRVDVSPGELAKYTVRPGDVIFNNTNSPERVGNAAVFDSELQCVFSNHMTRIRVRPDLIRSSFLALILHAYWKTGYSQRRARQWVNQAAIDVQTLARFRIPLPPLSEQQQIVEILREAELVRRLSATAEAKTADLIPSVFRKLFGDPNKNENGFPKEKLCKLGELDRGRSKHRPRDEPSLYGGPYPFIQTGDVAQSNGWIENYTQTYSEEGLRQSRLWPAGTVCITIAANIGATAILTFDACFPDSIVGFIPRKGTTAEYIRWWLLGYQAKLEAQAPAGAQKKINLKILGEIQIPVPPETLQDQFRRQLAMVRQNVQGLNDCAIRENRLSASLKANAFTGKLTAEWREQHKKIIQQEATTRDEALEATRVALPRPTMLKEIEEMLAPRTEGAYAELTREQCTVLEAIERGYGGVNYPRWFTAEEVAKSSLVVALRGNPLTIESHLCVLAARGLVIAVSREEQKPFTGETVYGNAYRLPVRGSAAEEAEPREPIVGDDSRLREMQRLVTQLEKGRME